MPISQATPIKSEEAAAQPIVWVVEDDPDVRVSITRLLKTINLPTHAVGSAKEALAEIETDRPGCLIMDMRLPDRDGLDLLQDLRNRGVAMPAIVITAFADVPAAVRALKLGVLDFLEKPFMDQQFIAAVQKAIHTDIDRFTRRQNELAWKQKLDRLSPRERDVLKIVITGRSSKMIAHELGLSQKTIENYRGNLMDKLGAENVVDLVRKTTPFVSLL